MRRLFALVEHLPPESALARAKDWWWTESHELAAVVAELGHAQWVTALATAGVKQGRLPKALTIPRPKPEGTPEPAKAPATISSIRATLLGGGV